jgi:hypothetical protein
MGVDEGVGEFDGMVGVAGESAWERVLGIGEQSLEDMGGDVEADGDAGPVFGVLVEAGTRESGIIWVHVFLVMFRIISMASACLYAVSAQPSNGNWE